MRPTPAPAPAPAPTRREALRVALAWCAYAALGVGSWLFDHRAFTGGGVARQAAAVLVESACWFALTFPILALAERTVREAGRARWVRALVGGVVVAVAMGWVGTSARNVARVRPGLDARPVPAAGPVGDGPRRGGRPPGPPIWLGMVNGLTLYLAVFGVGLSRATAREAERRRDEATRREAALQAQLAEARLDALRRQLDPHFLFNTLNAVSALVERDPRGVRRMLARLSDLLRFSFDGADRPEIPLRDELALVGRYVDIMQVRLQGRLTVEQRVDERVVDTLVPPLLLQPLVENAIKHGVERRPGAGRITIEAAAEGDSVVLRVADDGPGPGADPDAPADAAGRRHIGLANTAARLAQLHGDAASVALRAGPAGGTVAEVRLPRRPPAAARPAA